MGDKSKRIVIESQLYDNISAYCAINQLKFTSYVNELLKNAFMNDKFGDAPFLKKEKKIEVIEVKKNYIAPKVVVRIEEKKQDEIQEQKPITSKKRKLK